MDTSGITEYLDALGLGNPIRARVEGLIPAFQFLSDEPIQRVFLAELEPERDEAGLRWESLWGFSEHFWYQARTFMSTEHDIDVSLLKDSVSYIGFSCTDVAFTDGHPGQFTDHSRMKLEVETGGHIYSPVAATGFNCEALSTVISEYLTPNLRRG